MNLRPWNNFYIASFALAAFSGCNSDSGSTLVNLASSNSGPYSCNQILGTTTVCEDLVGSGFTSNLSAARSACSSSSGEFSYHSSCLNANLAGSCQMNASTSSALTLRYSLPMTLAEAQSSCSSNLGAIFVSEPIPSAFNPSLQYPGSPYAGVEGIALTITPVLSAGSSSGLSITRCMVDGSSVALPTGLSLHATTCVISGTPYTGSSGSYSLPVRVTNSQGASNNANVTIAISAVAIPSLQYPGILYSGVEGVPLTITPVLSTGGTGLSITRCVTDALNSRFAPAGLVVDYATCVISGTPAVGSQGSYGFHVRVTNSQGASVEAHVAIIINEGEPPSLQYSGSPYSGVEGTGIVITPVLSAGGAGLSITDCVVNSSFVILPAGLSLNPITCVISGTPAKGSRGSYGFPVKVTNSQGTSIDASIYIRINTAAVTRIVFTTPLPSSMATGVQQTFAVTEYDANNNALTSSLGSTVVLYALPTADCSGSIFALSNNNAISPSVGTVVSGVGTWTNFQINSISVKSILATVGGIGSGGPQVCAGNLTIH